MKDELLPRGPRETAQSIDETAAAWTARIDRGLTADEQTELNAWLGGDARRIGALARARALWLHSDRAAALGAPPVAEAPEEEDAPASRFSRRTALLGGGAIAASLALAAALPAILHRGRQIATNIGEIRRVPLGDGSVATLDTDSLMETAFTEGLRTVRLLSGVAYFEVAHDPARPFVVEARDVAVRAVGTAFSVRNLAGAPVSVVVSEGKVAIRRGAEAATVPLVANMRADIPVAALSAAIARPLTPDDLGRALAWREGMLAFEGETLAAAAARFRRYGGPAIEIDDRRLAGEPISGLFSASDPRGFAHAVAVSLDARVSEDGQAIRLERGRGI